MSIKLLMLRTGEEVISEVREITEPETERPLGYHLHKPVSYTHLTLPTNREV